MTGAALALRQRGREVAVITNDQGADLVDTTVARSRVGSVAEVTGGCFCCRFEDLVAAVVQLVERDGVDTVIAEAVGSCTDLQATVVRPLRRFYGDRVLVAPLTTVVDPLRYLAFDRAARRGEPESDLSYLFRQQLSEADVLAVNKLDTISGAQAAALLEQLRAAHPGATVVGYSAAHGTGLEELLAAWRGPAGNQDVELGIDYDRYAAAEAELAWMNQEFQLTAAPGPSPATAPGGIDAVGWGRTVLEHLSRWAADADALVGHAKLTVECGPEDYAKLSLTAAGGDPVLDRAPAGPASAARAVVNARVACEPAALDAAVAAAVAAADRACRTASSAADPVSFKPGYPRPVHRLAAADAPAARP
jgi:Ni2+-binding GTPase involved in maturation of urease and hydrogenase